MAARTRRVTLDESWREKIQTSMLINRLQADALGEIELSDGQRRSIEILLRKTAPDLQSVTIGGDAENPLVIVSQAGQSLDSKLARIIGGTAQSPSAYTH